MAATIWLTSVASGPAATGDVPLFVEMAPIVVPIVGSGRIDGALRVKFVLKAQDGEAQARLTGHLPELRANAVASAIEFSRLYVSTLTPVDAVKLRAMLTTALHAQDVGVADTLIVEVSAKS